MMEEKSSRRVLTVLFVSLLVDLLGFTVILPLLPSILEYYSTNEQVPANCRCTISDYTVSLLLCVEWIPREDS